MSRYGETYYSFNKNKDLFVILDTNINYWNIKDDQLNFLKKTLHQNMNKFKNLFIISHHIFWIDDTKNFLPKKRYK